MPLVGCPACGCEGEALNRIAGFCLRFGSYGQSRFCGQGQFISGPVDWRGPRRGTYEVGTCAQGQEVRLERDLKTGRTYPGLGQDQRAQSGFQRKSGSSGKRLSLMGGSLLSPGGQLNPDHHCGPLPSRNQSPRAVPRGRSASQSTPFPLANHVHLRRRGQATKARRNSYRLPPITSPEQLDFWTRHATHGRCTYMSHGPSLWPHGTRKLHVEPASRGLGRAWREGTAAPAVTECPALGQVAPHPHI